MMRLKKGLYYFDKPTPEEIIKMYQAASGTLLILTKNPRVKSLLWHICYIKYLSTITKNVKGDSSNILFYFKIKIFIILCRIIL